jgi:glycosyltransferase involved in cell wall biosynthesis
MRKRRILFLTVIPSPYQRELFERLSKADGLDVKVLYYSEDAHDRQWERPQLSAFETVMPGWRLRWPGGETYCNPRVVNSLLEARADIVVVSDYSAPTAQVAMRALTARRLPWVFWGERPGFTRRGKFGAFLRRQLQAPLSAATAIAAIGSKAVSAYHDRFPGKTVLNIPYFCDLAPYQEAKLERSTKPRSSVNILFSGQLIARKGGDILLSAFSKLAATSGNVSLTILGDGPERARLEAAVPPALRDRVKFLGHRQPSQIPEIFATADVFCLPSRHDGWGVVVNEAIGAGLPIVVSDSVGAGHDLVRHGENGLRVPTGDDEALAQALGRIVSDELLRQRLAVASSAMASDWGLDNGVSRWLAAIDLILGRVRAHA